MRKFERESTFSACALYIDDEPLKAFIINFSRMGAMVTTETVLAPKKFISLLYRNEKNQFIRIMSYVVYCHSNNRYFVSGLQFIGIESRDSA